MIRGIINRGPSAWAFEEFAFGLADVLWAEISETPADFNYVLGWDSAEPPTGQCFVPWQAMETAADKRKQAQVFARHQVPVPRTVLLGDTSELRRFLRLHTSQCWVLKYPISCGASGHQFVDADSVISDEWPCPFVLQEFIRMERPEVYRLYGIAGQLFGWNVRRFPAGVTVSPWVAHAKGARYVHLHDPPTAAIEVARSALDATGLINSFGIVDLLPSNGQWVVLEIGTDGLFSHVDRDVDNPAREMELNERLANAFWSEVEPRPWGRGNWMPRSAADNFTAL